MADDFSMPMKPWLALATDRAVVRRAFCCMLVVGSILISINHGQAILADEMNSTRWIQVGMTLIVPYCVSTYSSVSAMRANQRQAAAPNRESTPAS
ncbi:MAG: nitrate/nitrite transporter NrtS [Planctomycetes bacterium]|nr:nitrate/nitrite transporter NrtS [Planctomycetota bacterium]